MQAGETTRQPASAAEAEAEAEIERQARVLTELPEGLHHPHAHDGHGALDHPQGRPSLEEIREHSTGAQPSHAIPGTDPWRLPNLRRKWQPGELYQKIHSGLFFILASTVGILDLLTTPLRAGVKLIMGWRKGLLSFFARTKRSGARTRSQPQARAAKREGEEDVGGTPTAEPAGEVR